MQLSQVLSVLNADIVDKFKTAIEIGKWANGERLTPQQREICMQALIVWESNLPETQRTGYIDRGSKADGEACDDPNVTNHDDPHVITIRSAH